MNILPEDANKKILTLFAILIIIASIFSFHLSVNTIQYTKILETEANFDLKIVDFDTSHNIEKDDSGDWKGLLSINTTMKVWNNGSTPITVNQIWFDIYLNEVDSKNYMSSKGSKLRLVNGTIDLEPGESRVYDLDPATVNVTDNYYLQKNIEKENPTWNWIIFGGKAKLNFDEFEEEDWSYSSRASFESSVHYGKLEVGS